MKESRRTVLAGGCAALAAPAGGRAQDTNSAAASAVKARLEPLITLADPADPDGVLGFGVIARDAAGRRFYTAQGFGITGEGANRQARRFTLDTPVRVASISKMVATAALMRLVGAGKLRLQADVSDVLGWRLRHPAHPTIPITLTMLLSHTSGLRNGVNYPVPVGRRMRDVLTPGGPHFEADWFAPANEPPGRFAYCDLNFALVAQAIERASGERFDRYMTATVLRPLGLDAGYNWSGVSDAARARASACCRRVDGVWTPQVDAVVPPAPGVRATALEGRTADDYVPGENGFAFSPQGGLRASVRDLDRIARAFAAERIGSPRMLDPVWRQDGANGDTTKGYYLAYGLGTQIPTASTGSDAFFGPGSPDWRGHFGEAYGLVSGCWWNLKDGRSIAYVVNGLPREASETPGRRSAATPWEETIIDAALWALGAT